MTDMTAIDFTIEQVADDWEALADAGRTVAQGMDGYRFLLGDLALKVEKRYGLDALGKYSADIGMASRETLKGYRDVSRRFDLVVRATFLEAGLTFSHFKAAKRAGDDAELWLAQAQDNGWPVAELARQIASAIGQPVPPVLLYSGKAYIRDVGYAFHVALTEPVESDLADGLIVTVKVYAAGAE